MAARKPRAPEPWSRRAELPATAAELLAAIPASQFVVPKGRKLEDVINFAGHLDLFSGSRGAAKALADRSGRWVLTYDLKHDAREDLLEPMIQKEIWALLESDAFFSIGAGPVCASFSRAVRPPVRSREHPAGLADISANMEEKVSVGNAMSRWLALLIRRALGKKLVVWVENPWLSFLWWQDEWVELANDFKDQQVGFFTTDYCRWGTPWRKRTSFFGNLGVSGEKLLRACRRPHIRLVGYSAYHKTSWTRVAEPYPAKLCAALAALVVEQLKPVERRRRLDLAACAKTQARCIGEASNPGPRPGRSEQRQGTLEDVELVQLPTQLLQKRVLAKFHSWLEDHLSAEAWASLQAANDLQVNFLRSFGNWLFQQGEPMYIFRHLVVVLQQQFPMHSPTIAGSWDLLTRWEILQPVQHRTPLPKLLLDAMLALGIAWGWVRWSLVTALAFHGAMRIGEPLRAKREDLLLASEMSAEIKACFVHISAPKTSRRGRGRVQHARITEQSVVAFAELAVCSLAPGQMLYPGSHGSYRRRWDKLLEVLGVDKRLGLTPGSIRGGGAVHLYHVGVGVQDVLWRMRLRHLVTLESYLQEAGALNVLQRMDAKVRQRLKSCASMLPHFLRVSSFPSSDLEVP